MKSNGVNAIGLRNELTRNVNTVSRENTAIETKIIAVNPIITTNCEDSPGPHSYLNPHSELMSQSTTEMLRCPSSHSPREEEHYEQQRPWEEQPQSSIRKLYKEMKREYVMQQQEAPNFLYQSDRGEPPMEGSIKLHAVVVKEDEKHESDIMTSKNLTDILYKPIPHRGMVECVVKMASSSFMSMEKHIQLYLMKEKRLLLRAKKSRLAVSSQYEVFTPKEDNIATFLSNPRRTEYKYCRMASDREKEDSKSQKYDQTKATYDSAVIKLNPVRVELSSLASLERSYLVFRPNLLGTRQERLKIIRPRTKVGKSTRFSDIKAAYENFEYDRLEIFESRMAEKNSKGELVLDFKTNNIMESARNVMIEDEYGRVCLALYKRKESLYILSIMSPFTIIEGFFIALSNIDHLFF